jgi:hypothetical protein
MIWRRDSEAGERVPLAQGALAQAREHRGRDDHRRAEFDEERGGMLKQLGITEKDLK